MYANVESTLVVNIELNITGIIELDSLNMESPRV